MVPDESEVYKCSFLAERRFTPATWKFHESGHGKGVPDAISGLLADQVSGLGLLASLV